jgi:dTDP-4-dehydrorhamnose reductase
MRVVITGAGGQLGTDLLTAFADTDVVGLGHDDLDIADEAAVTAALVAHRPDLVVNAAAMTDVDGCESDSDLAHRVNALGPWWLARACDRGGATLVHVSTDYVFSGGPPVTAAGDPRGWTEFDPAQPGNEYGRSKSAGETLVRQTLQRHHIVRSSWLAGASGGNFVRTMLRLGQEGGPVRVVTDQVGSWTSTQDLAVAIRELAVSGRYGTVHRANAGQASWFEVAKATFEAAGLDVDCLPITTADMPRPAPRPAWSVLDQRHAGQIGLTPLPDWRQSLTTLVNVMQGTD